MTLSSTDMRLFKYPGGKTRVLDILYNCFPNHNTYIEPFGGSYVVLLNKKPVNVELINDVDPNIGALAYCFLLCPDELLASTEFELHSQELFNFFKNNDFSEKSYLEKALKKLYLIYHSYSALGESFAYNINQNRSLHYNSKINKDNLKRIHERLSNVHIFTEDFRIFLKRFYKTRNGFIYLDPPYTVTEKKQQYSFNFGPQDHKDLYEILNKFDSSKVKWLMSYDKKESIENYYSDYYIDEITVPYSLGCKMNGTNTDTTELLISNYNIKSNLNSNKEMKDLKEFLT